MPKTINRRTFLEFLGKGAVGAAFIPSLGMARPWKGIEQKIKPLKPTGQDALVLTKGFEYDVLIKWGDPISANDHFGYNNDYTAYIPFDASNPGEGILWVNHEYVNPLFVSGYNWQGERTRDQVQKEQYEVGGSLLHIRQEKNGQWSVVKNASYNRRLHAASEIPFNWPDLVAGTNKAVGTLANCAGGVTPWGTFLSCEENYDQFYGERNFKTGEVESIRGDIGWRSFFAYPPEHYGWVVEIDPNTGKAQKIIAMGRCAHESATVKELPDGRVVVYSGDDSINQCLYKFISSQPRSLAKGTLYVANVLLGRWVPVDWEQSDVLKKLFKDQTEVLVRLREAARVLGGTPLDRPEDIEIDPVTGHVFISLTNNAARGNYFGSILKIEEENGDYTSLTFRSETYLTGGEETGFACPDNMAFDQAGNLWFATDISGSVMHKDPYTAFKNNGLFVVPRNGPQAGAIIQVASAPTDAELTGITFAPDGKSMFLCVQHPGEESPSLEQLTSHWPDGDQEIPRSAVVVIRGEGLEMLQGLS